MRFQRRKLWREVDEIVDGHALPFESREVWLETVASARSVPLG